MNTSLRAQYLKTMGIQSWQLKSASENVACLPEEQPADRIMPPVADNPANSKEESAAVKKTVNFAETLVKKPESHSAAVALEQEAEFSQAIHSCRLCSSRAKRLNALVGEGDINASVFIISEAPTAEEDRSGHYLSATAQSLLHAMLDTIGLTEQYFLTGILKCHSLEQYLLTEEEVKNCTGHLHAQIQQINPSVLVVFGAQARMILQSKHSFNELRGNIHRLTINDREYPLVVSYHPAFLLRNPLYKKEALKDLILIKSLLQ